ncbi:DUF402 domain-containing protein [Nocardioides solisilvae]|uniref:DUF402 domain-containing protein n=1 Tax=Nocardioides solisilvae TaxID=1542435 RepID=UPI000D745727|nr:DUF402 domain-containing protein [Nocardioides solisilvae]
MSASWKPGDVVVRREILRGQPWIGWSVRVVEDSFDLLAVFLPSGSELGFGGAETLGWEHPWKASGRRAWSGHGKLMLMRPDDAYAVELSWKGPERDFEGWRILLQEPIRRHDGGFDTLGHGLDFEMAPDGSWKALPDTAFEQRVAQGRYDAAQAEQVRATAAGVKSMLQWRNQWWDRSWAAWTPPADWAATTLPEGWASTGARSRAAG